MVTAEPELVTLPIDSVLEDRNFNVRLFYGDIDLLAIQLMTEGQREPIKVRSDGKHYFVIDGHRRRRAFERAGRLRIAAAGAKHMVFEGDRALREASGPARKDFDPTRIACRLIGSESVDDEVLASQLVYNCGKPFTLLERMLLLSKLGRGGRYTKEQLALKAGVSRTAVANATSLNSADPRLLERVGSGQISQKLALRIVREFPAEEQLDQVAAAMKEAERHNRLKLLPKDFEWPGGRESGASRDSETRADPVRFRLCELATRMADAARFAANDVARDRLGTVALVHRYATGKLSYPRLEAHLLGRE